MILAGCQNEEDPPEKTVRPVKTHLIQASIDKVTRSFPGVVEASQKTDLSFRVPGKIVEFPVEEGQKITQGQLIAELDQKDYQLRVKEAKARHDLAKASLDRAQILIKKKFMSRSDFDRKKTEYDVRKSEYDAAQKNLSYTTINAPFSGVIAKKYIEQYETIQEKQQIARLHNLETIDVSIDVPESLALNFRKFDISSRQVEFELAKGKKYDAQFKSVTSEADPDTQSYEVIVSLPSPSDLNVFPGMTVTVYADFTKKSKLGENVFLVPASSVVQDENNTSFVWVVAGEPLTTEKVAVEVSGLQGEFLKISNGLEPGQRIVSAGVHFISEGMEVKILE